MDAYEATKIVFSRIQGLDPENASKIMGLLLIQDHGEKEMIRLAFGPETLLHSVILKARKELGISSNTPSTPSTPSSPSPFNMSRQSSSSSSVSSRLLSTSAAVGGGVINLPSPLSIPNQTTTFSDFHNPEDLISPSAVTPAPTAVNGGTAGGTELVDEFQLQDHLSFLNDGSPFYPPPDLLSSPGGEFFPSYGGGASWLPHRRSCSVNDICLGSDDANGGFGWKPCLYYARGYCKNGTSCRFLHNGFSDLDTSVMVGSPGKVDMMEQCQELLRSKSAHQQRLAVAASQLMGSSSFPYSASKGMNFLLQQQQNDTQRALMMGDDMHKYGRARVERNDFSVNGGMGIVNPGSRQIYLTFPADSTFREEDVSNYFSIYGPVQDVRIPYQQKRMFGFVTFVYPETVKIILAKGNPHFVCDARVLVKPYKEKGKVPDKYRKQQQQGERGDYSACSSPTGLDARDPYDFQLGARMFYNTQDMLWRRKLEEQADLQQAIEMQGRRLMGLQLLDVKKNHHRNLSPGTFIPSPTQSPNLFSQNPVLTSGRTSPEALEDNCSSPAIAIAVTDQKVPETANVENFTNGNGNGKESPQGDDNVLPESLLEHNLPDSPFASPTKAAGEYMSAFALPASEVEKNPSSANSNLITSSLLPATSTLDMASFKSCYFQMPRLSSGHGAIGM